jgi:SH3 domain-containing YSC84-like protein 1
MFHSATVEGSMRTGYLMAATLAALAALMAPASAQEEQGLVDKARVTLESMAAQEDMIEMRRMLAKAQAVFIAPQMIKAGFIIGGEGGSGVLLARDPNTGGWSPPAFYTLAAGSIGWQFGGEVSELVLVVYTAKGLDAMLKSGFKAGLDGSIAVGPLGKGVEASTTANLRNDIFSFSRAQGLFAGVSLEGAVIQPRENWNEAYYGKKLTPREIVTGVGGAGRASEALRQALAKAELR